MVRRTLVRPHFYVARPHIIFLRSFKQVVSAGPSQQSCARNLLAMLMEALAGDPVSATPISSGENLANRIRLTR